MLLFLTVRSVGLGRILYPFGIRDRQSPTHIRKIHRDKKSSELDQPSGRVDHTFTDPRRITNPLGLILRILGFSPRRHPAQKSILDAKAKFPPSLPSIALLFHPGRCRIRGYYRRQEKTGRYDESDKESLIFYIHTQCRHSGVEYQEEQETSPHEGRPRPYW